MQAVTAQLAEAHRVAQVRLAAQTHALMNVAWRTLDPLRLDQTRDTYLRLARPIVQRQRAQSASLSADYYAASRSAVIDAPSVMPALDATLDATTIDASLQAEVFDRLTDPPPRQSWEQTVRNARASANATAARLANNGGRGTILNMVASDRYSLGWSRTGRGEACPFCLMLISRGPVYKAESSAGFDAHNRCYCQPVPAFTDDDLWSKQAAAAEDVYYSAIEAAEREAAEGLGPGLHRGTSNDRLNALRRYRRKH